MVELLEELKIEYFSFKERIILDYLYDWTTIKKIHREVIHLKFKYIRISFARKSIEDVISSLLRKGLLDKRKNKSRKGSKRAREYRMKKFLSDIL